MVDWSHENARAQGGPELVLLGGRVLLRQVAESDPGRWQTVLQDVNLSRGHKRIKSQLPSKSGRALTFRSNPEISPDLQLAADRAWHRRSTPRWPATYW